MGMRHVSKMQNLSSLMIVAPGLAEPKLIVPERKVRCDAQRPTCGNCQKAKRVCKGYGVQLSWPRDGDEKRAVVLRYADTDLQQRHVKHASSRSKFVNTGLWDVELAMQLELASRDEDWRTMVTDDPGRQNTGIHRVRAGTHTY